MQNYTGYKNDETRKYKNQIKISKILIWISIAFSLISIIFTIVGIIKYGNGIAGYSWEIAKIIIYLLILLLYILPLILVKNMNVLKNWSLTWLILASLSLVWNLITFIWTIFIPWYVTTISLLSTILTFTGSILLIISCKKLIK